MYKKLLLFTISIVFACGLQRMAFAQSESSATEQIPNYDNDQITEPMIAVNPSDESNFITAYSDWYTPGNRYPGVSYTTDGGQTWSQTLATVANSGYDQADPSVAFDGAGHAWYCYLNFKAPTTDPTTQIIVDESTDGGKDWSSSFLMPASTSSGNSLDKPWIACDQTGDKYANSIYTAWTLETNATDPSSETFQIYFSYCRPGSTFHTPIPISSQVTNPEDVLGANSVA